MMSDESHVIQSVSEESLTEEQWGWD